jgi:hypothetical protein
VSLFEEYRREIVEAFRRDDPHAADRWAKGWIGSGGGARTVEPWLVYVAAAVSEGQPRRAVHSTDLALRHWIEDAVGRAVLRYVRGEVIRRHLRDPKTALADLRAARPDAPGWLAEAAGDACGRCEAEAASSRKRKPSVGDAPGFGGDPAPAPDLDYALAAQPPPLWATLHAVLAS